MEKHVDTRIKLPICLLLCLLVLCVLLSACTLVGDEETTSDETVRVPETTAEITPETSAEVTDELTTDAAGPETTLSPEHVSARVKVYGADGSENEYSVEVGMTLSAGALEAVEIPTESDRMKVSFNGWEYSTEKDGERKPYDVNDPPAVGESGMHVYPVIEYSYFVSFSAGDGKFAEGTETGFFIKSGESFKPSELLSSLPAKAEDGEYSYPLLGFMVDGKQIATDEEVTVSSPLDLTAVYGKADLIYTVIAHTEYGSLIGGGKTKLFEGSRKEAEEFVSSYDNYTPEDVYFDDAVYSFSEVSVKKEGREWTLELIWTSTAIRFTLTFDYGEGQEAVLSHISADGKAILPTPERREDKERYYDFVGWRDKNGHLYNGGYEITVTEDMSFSAEFARGERKVYTVVFDTEIGFFTNGSPDVVLTGFYGDALIPPSPPDVSSLTFGEVVYEFAGWNAQVPATFTEDLSFTAVYTTPHPVYYLNFYLDEELYLSVPHYASSPLTAPARPESTLGMIFSGWADMPVTMPESDIDIYATSRIPEVVYMLDGEVFSRIEAKAGTLVTLAAPVQKHGYTVSGWITEDIESLQDGGFVMPENDVVFNASSSPKPHTVKYIIDGITLYSDSVLFGEIYTVRGIEVKTGYEFTGWKIQNSSVDAGIGIISVPDEDIVFVGGFERCSYNVNYYLDEILLYTDTYYYGDTVILRPDEEQAGCTFSWNSAGADISSGIFGMPAGDVDIYGSFSDGDNSIIFMIDGKEYGTVGVTAGKTVDLGFMPTKLGYTFTGWSCDEVDASSGEFIMSEGDIILRGSFVPNSHDVIFIDIATGDIISTSYLDYGSSFSLGDRAYCAAGKVSDGWVLLEGHAVRNGDEYIMPDSDVVFGVIWIDCLTLEIDENYHIPYYALLYDEYGGCRYDEAAKTVYISEPSIKVAGESEGITVVYENIIE